MKEKRCIFHIPNYIDKTSKSGSSVRPQMMIKAFEEIGYHVDYVMGYGKERKSQIEKIKRNIRNGVKYEFLYAENSTTPTLLTEKNHIPKYPSKKNRDLLIMLTNSVIPEKLDLKLPSYCIYFPIQNNG